MPSALLAPPVFEAVDLANIVAHPPILPDELGRNPEFVVGAVSHGLTVDLINYGYQEGLMPWPSLEELRENLYPWGRVSLCTVLSTQQVHLTRSLKKRLRDALARHYEGKKLDIRLDESYDTFVDTVADHYNHDASGTWLTNEMRATWKAAHRVGLTHCITVFIDGKLEGGLLFGSKGGMLYGESALSWKDDVSKLALVALCALGRVYHLPYIDCQVYSPYVSSFRPFSWGWNLYIPAQQKAVSLPTPDWASVPRDLIPILTEAFPELTPRPAKSINPRDGEGATVHFLNPMMELQRMAEEDGDEELLATLAEPEETPAPADPDDVRVENELSPVSLGRQTVLLPILSRQCSYFDDRRARYEIMVFNQTNNREANSELYSFASTFGFRREGAFMSRAVCEGCHLCLPTRVDVPRFQPTSTMTRIMRRNRDLIASFKPVRGLTDEQWALYERYEKGRHPESHMATFTRQELKETLFDTTVINYVLEIRTPSTAKNPNQLMMVCIIDQLENALSAVYNFYDPDVPKQSLGTFGILSEIFFARQLNLGYLYLGHWLKDYPGMDYKRNFRPLSVFYQERWIDIEDYLRETSSHPVSA